VSVEPVSSFPLFRRAGIPPNRKQPMNDLTRFAKVLSLESLESDRIQRTHWQGGRNDFLILFGGNA
jgi:hypothetical protein